MTGTKAPTAIASWLPLDSALARPAKPMTTSASPIHHEAADPSKRQRKIVATPATTASAPATTSRCAAGASASAHAGIRAATRSAPQTHTIIVVVRPQRAGATDVITPRRSGPRYRDWDLGWARSVMPDTFHCSPLHKTTR